jgi:hypothetical protein
MRAGVTIAAAVAGLALAAVGVTPLSPGASGATTISSALPVSIEMLVKAPEAQIERAERAPKVLGVPRTRLNSIASCESGGDPTSVSSDGTYRGKYQFDRGTWASEGGHGDPAKAPELEQDFRAAALYKQDPGRWPNCG